MSYPKNNLEQELMLALISLMSIGVLYFYGSAFKGELITSLVLAGLLLIAQLVMQNLLDDLDYGIYVMALDYILGHFYCNFVVSLIFYVLIALFFCAFPILLIMLFVAYSIFMTLYPWSLFVTRKSIIGSRKAFSGYLQHEKFNGFGGFLGWIGKGILYAIFGIVVVVVFGIFFAGVAGIFIIGAFVVVMGLIVYLALGMFGMMG